MNGVDLFSQLKSSQEIFECKALPAFDELLTNFEKMTDKVVELYFAATEAQKIEHLSLWVRTYFGIRDEYILLHIGAVIRPYQKITRSWPAVVQTTTRKELSGNYELLNTEKGKFKLVSCSERGLTFLDKLIQNVRIFAHSNCSCLILFFFL